jgi:hypothetical protein
MHISSQKPSVVRRSAYRLYLVVTSLILLGIISEGLLIGPSLFTKTTWGRAVHEDLAGGVLLLTLLLPIVARLARLPRRLILLSVALFVLTLIEAIAALLALDGHVVVMAAFHPANALLMVALTMLLLMQGWQPLRQRSNERKTRGGSSS